jgi:hypothetical protein
MPYLGIGRISLGAINDRDWLDVSRAAAMEFDRDNLPASIDVAEKAYPPTLTGIADCTL